MCILFFTELRGKPEFNARCYGVNVGAVIDRPTVPCCRQNLCPGEFAEQVRNPYLYFSKDSKPARTVLFLFRQEKYPKEADLVGGVELNSSRSQSHILRYDCHRQSL